jgi:signal transduction histidine kinase
MRADLPIAMPGALVRVRGRGLVLGGVLSLLAIALLIPVFRLQGLEWIRAIPAATFFVVSCVALGWAAWRLLLQRRRHIPRTRALFMHALAALAFSLTWTAAFTALVYVLGQQITIGFLRQGAVWQFVWGIIIYAVLVQAAFARERLKEKELAAANAELQALRSQLDPHFLFNTLHSLTQLVREDPVATQNALERFGDLMRYVLTSSREADAEVTVEDEIEFVRNYLQLEQVRLGERLRIIENIEPDALELAVPPLLLQPLVENAIRHGIAPRRDGGTLRLTVRIRDDELLLQVADNGNGCQAGVWSTATGVGLQAVRRQLQARFGGAARCDVDSTPGAGFIVHLVLPARVPRRLA